MIAAHIIVAAPATKPVYSWAQIEVVAQWQNFGSGTSGLATKLAKVAPLLPKSARVCKDVCYRAIGLSGKQIQRLLDDETLKHRRIESWTTSTAALKEYIGMSSSLIEGPHLVLLKHVPKRAEVVLNLDALWKDPQWKASVAYWEDSALNTKKWFNEGLDFKGSQKEVALARTGFTIDDVYGVVVNGAIKRGKDPYRLLESFDMENE